MEEKKFDEIPKLQEKTMKEKVDDLYNIFQDTNVKKKELKLLRKAKVRKRKLRKGYIGIIRIDENMVASGEKAKIEESTCRTKDGTTHGFDATEMMMWNGKFPVLIQPTWKNSPLTIREKDGKNETAIQKLIKLRILRDTIKETKEGGFGILWFLIAGIVLFVGYNYIKTGNLF
jgi:hypothetical protein